MAVNEEVEAYLRSLYAQPQAEFVPFASPEAAVAFQPDMTPQAERPRFGSMLEGQVDPVTGQTMRKPAIQAVREARMAELAPLEAEAEAASLSSGEAMMGAAPMGMQARAPLPAGMPSTGAGGPMAYMDALAAAQREDELAAGIGRILPSVEQVAQIQSRGAYRPTGLGAVPSAVSRVQQRQAAVTDFLRQQREGELSAAQLDAMRALAEQRRREPMQREPVETEAQRKQREAAAERDLALAEKARKEATQVGKPKVGAGASAKPDPTEKPKLRALAASDIKELAEIDVAMGQLRDLSQRYEELQLGGLAGRAGAAVTGALGLTDTDAAKYAARARIVQQGIGKILEGGKLAAGDEAKYREMLPKPGDGPGVLKEKTEAMAQYLADLKAKGVAAFQGAGFQVPGQEQAALQQPQPVKTEAVKAEDEAKAALAALRAAAAAQGSPEQLSKLRVAAEAAIKRSNELKAKETAK